MGIRPLSREVYNGTRTRLSKNKLPGQATLATRSRACPQFGKEGCDANQSGSSAHRTLHRLELSVVAQQFFTQGDVFTHRSWSPSSLSFSMVNTKAN